MEDGSGITLTNMFRYWHPDKLLLTCLKMGTPNSVLFKNMILLETSKKTINHNDVNSSDKENVNSAIHNNVKNVKFNIIRSIVIKLKEFLRIKIGLINILYKINVSENLLLTIKKFNPDIIYAVPTDYIITRFIYKLQKKLKLSLALHFIEDYKKDYRLLPVWNILFSKMIYSLVNNSQALFSISEEMSTEYNKIFKRKFETIMNYVNDVNYVKAQNVKKHNQKDINFFYCGNVGEIRGKTLLNFCNALKKLNECGYNIRFDIRSPLTTYYHDAFSKYSFVKLLDFIKVYNDEILLSLTSYNFLLLPVNFDAKTIKLTLFSMSTNIPEFIISGVPVILFAPEEIAMVKSANKYGWAYTITNDNLEDVKNSLIKIIENKELQTNIIEKAELFSKQFYNPVEIQKIFLNNLSGRLK